MVVYAVVVCSVYFAAAVVSDGFASGVVVIVVGCVYFASAVVK